MKSKLIDVTEEVSKRAYRKYLRGLEDEDLQKLSRIKDEDLDLEATISDWRKLVADEIARR
jgi:hypothetical protein